MSDGISVAKGKFDGSNPEPLMSALGHKRTLAGRHFSDGPRPNGSIHDCQ
jgi:hypothetical protein